jgi:hypothetical protein
VSLSNRWKLAAFLASGMIVAPALAADSGSSQPDLSGEIQALKARIDQLQTQQDAQNLASREAQQRAAQDSLIKDASQHSQLFDSVGFSAGWNASKQQFFIGSEDGKFYAHPIIIFQFRGIANDREKTKKHFSDDTQLGFEIRRAKWGFDGNLFTPDLTYKFQWQGTQTTAPTVEYAFAQYVFAKHIAGGDFALRAGQFRGVFSKEETVGDTNQLLAERSLANALIGGNAPAAGAVQPNAVQGVDLLWLGRENPVHAEIVVHDGYAGALTTFTQPHGTAVVFPQVPANPPSNPSYGGVQGRVDWKLFGDWTDTTDFTGINSGKKDLLDIGVGADYSDEQGAKALRYTADAQYQISHKLSLYVAGYGDNFNFRRVKTPATTPHIINNYGGLIQGGYLLTPAWQAVARYSVTKLDDKFKIGGWGTFQEIAAGLNYFGPDGTWGNHAKFTVDVNYLPDGTPAAAGLEYLASTANRSEVVLRAQWQVWF